MKKINKEVYYDPAVVIVHEHGATISKNIATYRKNVLQFESESYYYHEYRNVPKFLIKMGLWSMKGYLLLKNRV